MLFPLFHIYDLLKNIPPFMTLTTWLEAMMNGIHGKEHQLCFASRHLAVMIWFQGQPRHVSYFQKNPHLMSFLYHYMSMFLISPSFFFLACFSLYFLIFFISYLLRPVLVPWPRLLSVCVYLLSVPWATNWDTKNKKAGITILHDPRHCMVPRFWKRL